MNGYEYEYCEEDEMCIDKRDYEIMEDMDMEQESPVETQSPMVSPSVSVQDLEEKYQYEIQWHLRGESYPKCVVAEFERKIFSYDPRYMTDHVEECHEFDLVFKQVVSGNSFVIHSDLIQDGMVEFYPLENDEMYKA